MVSRTELFRIGQTLTAESENPVMKTAVTKYLRNQSGAAEFDGMTAFLLVVVFPISMYFMYKTFGGVFEGVFGLFGSAAYR